MMDRDQHLAWAKKRALEYVDHGDLSSAVASMASDLGKHESWAGKSSMIGPLTMIGLHSVMSGDAAGVRRWIEGFN